MQIKEHLSWEVSINIKNKFFLIRLHSSTFAYTRLDSSRDSSQLVYVHLHSSSDSSVFLQQISF